MLLRLRDSARRLRRIAGQVEEAWPIRKGGWWWLPIRIAENAGRGLVLGRWGDWLGSSQLGRLWRAQAGVADVDKGSFFELSRHLDRVCMLCELECEVVEMGEGKEKRRRKI
jgi:hypothetical protein